MIFNEIQELTLKSDIKVISKELGYPKEQNFKQALINLKKSNSLFEFLSNGHFDWTHNSRTLILALSKYFKKDIKDELEKTERYYEERLKFKGSYVYVNTDFKPRDMTQLKYVALSLSRQRYIGLESYWGELFFKSLTYQLNFISKIVKNHYKNQKILSIYGNITVNITSYTLYFSGKTYELDTDGKFV